ATSGRIIAAGRRPWPRLLRRPPEQHPLQHSEVSPEPLQLGVPLRTTLTQPRHLLPQQRVVLDHPVSQLRQLPVRLQGLSQQALRRRRPSTLRIPDHASRNRHAAQQTRSATANHAPRTSVSQPAVRGTPTTQSQDFRVLTKKYGLRHSAGRTGICYDNAMAESFFAALKNERVYRTQYPTREHARRDVVRYIEFWYNSKRRHSGLQYRTPQQVHDEHLEQQSAA